MGFCRVILSGSLETFSNQGLQTLTYSIPEELKDQLVIGSLVSVPFRSRKENALVIDKYNSLSSEEEKFKIRDIDDLISSNLYSQELVEVINFVAEYYCCSYTEVLDAILPSRIVPKANKIVKLVNPETIDHPLLEVLNKGRGKQLSWARLQLLSGLDAKELKSQISKLRQKNLIEIVYENKKPREKKQENHLESYSLTQNTKLFDLSSEQASALDYISPKLNSYSEFLIHGVTGSGKTEIYLRLIDQVLQAGKSSIFLVPEISLAPQLLERIAERFGEDKVLIWHSALSNAEKEYTYARLQEDDPKIVVGARSAIFCPVKKLGLIIIDEEHENSYKQDTPAPRYNAKLVASKRSEINNCPVIYGSATPSLEIYYKASSDKFPNNHLITLENRVLNIAMPEVKVIDMKEEFNNANKSIFSRYLKDQITERLAKNEQVILFLNKRGSASHVFCRNCGFIYKCKHCDSKTVYHADKALLLCHHCGYSEGHPKECPECKSNAIKFFGLGTQKLEDETRRIFPEAKIARLDSDTSKIKNAYLSIWNDFRAGRTNVLIGTQMIAKGLDFPNLTLVGVVFADTNFSQLDYNADERSFQLLTQVAGRAGRADKPGMVVFQTYQPDKDVIIDAQKQDYRDFFSKEILIREEFKYPPFGKVIKFLFSSEEEHTAIAKANDFHELIFDRCNLRGIALLGPCPALIAKIKNKYRYHIIAKIPMEKGFEADIEYLKESFKTFRTETKSENFNFLIDIDNISLY